MSKKVYGNKEIIGDSPCPACRAKGGDKTGNHLQHWRNTETNEEWTYCNRCGHGEKINDDNRASIESVRQIRRELSPEELKEIIDEAMELPIMELKSRSISRLVAERFGVRVGLSETNREVVSHFYPKKKDGELVAFKIRNLDPKYFYAIGNGSGCDFFGMDQAQLGDVWGEKLFVFEDELSCMSGYQVLIENSKSVWKPACVALPDGSGSAASAFVRCARFVDNFKEIVVCMDNDEAGEKAVQTIRSMHPNVKIARLPKAYTKDGKKLLKDANDFLMEGRGLEVNNALRFNAAKESPAGAATVADCLDDALKKPEWGIPYPWEGLTQLTYGIRFGELISVGGGTSTGKTLIAHEICSWLINNFGIKCGCFMLEETVGNTIKNIAGKSAGIAFHKPDGDFDPDLLRQEALKYDGKLFLYKNFGSNDWEDIKRVIRFWVVEQGIKVIFLDNITCLVSHLTATEINSEVSKIGAELAGLCQELDFTCFVFSHLNPPKSGVPHEEGGAVQEVQFTGSRALMRFSQLMLGFERNKQADGDWKNLSQIRLLKDRNFGASGTIGTIYNPVTGRLTERSEDMYDKKRPFMIPGEAGSGGEQTDIPRDDSRPDVEPQY